MGDLRIIAAQPEMRKELDLPDSKKVAYPLSPLCV